MGGCASRPKDLDNENAPAPVEATAVEPAVADVAEPETVAQEKTDEVEAKEEEPLVDLSEPAPEAPKTEEEVVEEAKNEVVA